jgi:hypothetical protein
MHKTHIILQHYQWIRQAELQIKSKSPYREVKHLIPASVICESLFSDARHIMTDFRRSMDPSTLEMLLILKYNKDLWDARTVDQIINTKKPAVGQKRPNPVTDIDTVSVITD